MQKMIPLAKMQKKLQKAYFAEKRGTWNGLSPVTRVVPNGKAYNRNKAKKLGKSELF
ncbi:MAG: hypothetical protein IIZ49_03785 [Oscillospiraceae bacterium]|nr:hypothetical protein [Oscillospiraceae bacterium]MBQ3880377.1 hypothetical protein [Oscillospiraceae bacterium]